MAFSSLLINDVAILTTSGTDWEGFPVHTLAASGVPARVELRNRQVVNSDGEVVTANITIYLAEPNGYNINSGDQVLHDGDHYVLLDVQKQQDDVKVHHLELLGQTSRRLS